jgi:hypothetical protein
MECDLNLVFGVLVVQLGKLTPSQLIDAAGAWATDPSKDLPQRLFEACVMQEQDRNLVSGLVKEAVRAFGGDIGGAASTG